MTHHPSLKSQRVVTIDTERVWLTAPRDGGPRLEARPGEAFVLDVAEERWVRRDERRFLRTLIDATITDGEYQRLLLALAQLDPKAKQTCGNLVHVLVCVLDGLEQETQAA